MEQLITMSFEACALCHVIKRHCDGCSIPSRRPRTCQILNYTQLSYWRNFTPFTYWKMYCRVLLPACLHGGSKSTD